MSGYDDLTPTEELVMEVLAGRWRTGEHFWTFAARAPITRAAKALADKGLVWLMHGQVERTFRAGLTEAGQSASLDPTYNPPRRCSGCDCRWDTCDSYGYGKKCCPDCKHEASR